MRRVEAGIVQNMLKDLCIRFTQTDSMTVKYFIKEYAEVIKTADFFQYFVECTLMRFVSIAQ
ncbi:hypothetical protein D3C71_2044850 [compost metagenome]